MTANPATLARAIVLGSTLLAAAIVFAAVYRPPPAAPVAPIEAPVAAPPFDRDHARAEAARALERLRPHMIATCWTPTSAEPGPPAVRVQFNLGFTADGNLGGWGINEDRASSRPAVAACLRTLPLDGVRIPAPGAPLTLEVPLTLP